MHWLATSLLTFTLAAQDYPPPFPRTNATKLLENDHIVVWDIVWPKGEPTALHRHVYDQVGTYYQAGGRVITTPAGEARGTTTEVGRLSTTRKGTLHIEEGATDPPLRAVFIELKHDRPYGPGAGGAPQGSASAFPGRNGKPAFDDDRVTIWDRTAVRGSSGSFGYPRDTVIVWLSAGTVRWTPTGAPTETLHVMPGHMRYVPRGTSGTEVAVAGDPRAIIFELK